jgi:hypothetical protein
MLTQMRALTRAQRRLLQSELSPFDASDAWRTNGNRDDPPKAKNWAHAAARACIAELQERQGIAPAFDGISEVNRSELVHTLSQIIRAAQESAWPRKRKASP